MRAVESPGAGASPSGCGAEPAAAPPDGPHRDSPRPPSSLCGSPGLGSGSGSLQPDSLQTFPGLGSESPSIQCDSLECPCCCCCCRSPGSAGSAGVCEDSLQPPLAACKGRACGLRAARDLSDSLESFGAQHDSLRSVSSLRESLRSSSVQGDSLESLSSLSSGSGSQHSGLEVASQ